MALQHRPPNAPMKVQASLPGLSAALSSIPFPPSPQLQEECDRGKELEGGDYEEEEYLEGQARRAADKGARARASRRETLQESRSEEEAVAVVTAQEDEGEDEDRDGHGAGEVEEEDEEEVMELDEEKELQEEEAVARRQGGFVDDTFEEELMAQLEEYEQLIQEFHFQLEITRTRYSLTTGGVPEEAKVGPAVRMPRTTHFALGPSWLGPCGGSTGPLGWEQAATPQLGALRSPRDGTVTGPLLPSCSRLMQEPSSLYSDRWNSKSRNC